MYDTTDLDGKLGRSGDVLSVRPIDGLLNRIDGPLEGAAHAQFQYLEKTTTTNI